MSQLIIPELIRLISLAALTENLSGRRNLAVRTEGGERERESTQHLLPGHELELRQALAATLATASTSALAFRATV